MEGDTKGWFVEMSAKDGVCEEGVEEEWSGEEDDTIRDCVALCECVCDVCVRYEST